MSKEPKRQMRRDEHGRPFSGPSCEHGVPYGTMWPCKICMQPKPIAPKEQEKKDLCSRCSKPYLSEEAGTISEVCGCTATKEQGEEKYEIRLAGGCYDEIDHEEFMRLTATLRSQLEEAKINLQAEEIAGEIMEKVSLKYKADCAEKDKRIEELIESKEELDKSACELFDKLAKAEKELLEK